MILSRQDCDLVVELLLTIDALDFLLITRDSIQVMVDKRKSERVIHKDRLQNIVGVKLLGDALGYVSDNLGLCFSLDGDDIEVGIYEIDRYRPLAWFYLLIKGDPLFLQCANKITAIAAEETAAREARMFA